jgi:hypothetical protein
LWGAPRIHGELLKLGFEVAISARTERSARRIPIDHPKLEKMAGDALEMANGEACRLPEGAPMPYQPLAS